MSRNLCYTCFDDITWRMHGMTENFNAEIKRYANQIYEGLTVNCINCGRTAFYNRNESTGKWTQSYVEVVE